MEGNSEKKGEYSFNGLKTLGFLTILSFRHKTVSSVDFFFFFPSSVCCVSYAKYLNILPL